MQKSFLRRPLLLKCVLLTAVVLLTLTACEAVARWLGEEMTPPVPFTAYQARPWGSVMAPETAPGLVNAHGTFDVEHTLDKPPGVVRVALLGDSFLGLPSLPHAVQTPQQLQGRLGDGYEVLNFSVSSAGTANEYLRYLHDARRFAPDLVLLFFTVSNDARNNSVVLQPKVEAAPISLPGFVLDDGQLRQVTIPAAIGSACYYESSPKRWLASSSAVYRKASRACQAAAGARVAVPVDEQWAITASFLQTPNSDVQIAWDVTEALLGALKEAVARDGARLAVVLVPTSWDIESGWRQFLLDHLPAHVSTETLDYERPYTEILTRTRRQDIPVLDLCSAFRAASDEKLYDETGHWNVRGHATAAEATTTFVKDLLGR